MRTIARFYRRARGRRATFYAVILTAFVLFMSSSLLAALPFRLFLAQLTQDLVIARVNPHRTSVGVAALTVDPGLSEAARAKAEDMIARDYFAHTGPGGEVPWVWLDRVGYRYAAAGENLAKDFSDPTALVRAWLNSPTHRENIENGVFTDIGIGIASGEWRGTQTTVVVMFLGRKLSTQTAAALAREAPPPAPAPPPQPPPPAPAPPPPAPPTPEPAPTPVPEPTQEEPVAQPPPPARPPVEVPPSEPLVAYTVDEEDIHTAEPSSNPAEKDKSLPLTTVLAFIFTRSSEMLRYVLSASFGSTFIAGAALAIHPSFRRMVRPGHQALMLGLLGLLWLPL